MNTDPIADYLTRLRNACLISRKSVNVPYSKLKEALTKLLQSEGYIESYRTLDEEGIRTIQVSLKYDTEGYPVIRRLKRVSRPGLRKYFGVNNIPRILNGAGVAVLTTNKGLLSDRQARRERVGGELLCIVH